MLTVKINLLYGAITGEQEENTGIDVVGEQKCYCESGVASLTAESEIFEV